jgi:transcriptional regulator with AAA-type ATPase domain
LIFFCRHYAIEKTIFICYSENLRRFAHKYKTPAIKLEDEAIPYFAKIPLSGNIRQLRSRTNFGAETKREISYKP